MQENPQQRAVQNEQIYTELMEQIDFCNLHNYKVVLCMDANAHVSTQLGMVRNRTPANRNGRLLISFIHEIFKSVMHFQILLVDSRGKTYNKTSSQLLILFYVCQIWNVHIFMWMTSIMLCI